MESTKINDFYSYDDVNKDIQENLTKDDEVAAQRCMRYCIRGKLNRNVYVLVNRFHCKCIELILRYRKQAGIPDNNPHVFELPSTNGVTEKYVTLPVTEDILCSLWSGIPQSITRNRIAETSGNQICRYGLR